MMIYNIYMYNIYIYVYVYTAVVPVTSQFGLHSVIVTGNLYIGCTEYQLIIDFCCFDFSYFL